MDTLTPPRPDTSTRAAWLSAAYYAVLFAALGAHLPFWPVWLQTWGLTEAEIGWYLGVAVIARIAGTSLIPAIADRYAKRRLILSVTAAATALAHVLHLAVGTQEGLLILTLAAAVLMAPATPIGDALGLRAAAQGGFSYARVRAAGSAAFLVTNVAIGALLGTLGADVVLWTVAIGFAAVAVLGAIHPGGGAAPRGRDNVTVTETLRLLRSKVFLVFALASAIGQASHMVYYAYSVLDWRASGISDMLIGWLWGFGVLVETVLMLTVGRAWIARLGPVGALCIAAIAGVLRWSAMALSPQAGLLWPLQALHALSFALGYLGAMAFLSAALPARMIATAHGLKSGILGGSANALALLAAAQVVAMYGISTAYVLAATMAALSLGLCVWLALLWTDRPITDDPDRT